MGGIFSRSSQRLGRTCNLKPVNTKHKNIWKGCLSQEGPRLFNSLPRSLRDMTKCSKDLFKKHLDIFLATVPDEPLLSNYFNLRQADSNTLLVWKKSSIFQPRYLLMKNISTPVGEKFSTEVQRHTCIYF